MGGSVVGAAGGVVVVVEGVVVVVVASFLLGFLDAVVRDGASGHQMTRVVVQLARRLQVGPLVAVAQVTLTQVPQRVALLHSPAEQLVAPVNQVMRQTFVPCTDPYIQAARSKVRPHIQLQCVRNGHSSHGCQVQDQVKGIAFA